MSLELTTTPDLAFDSQILTGAGTATADLGPVWILEEVAGHLRAQGRKTGTPRMRLYRLGGDVLTALHEQELVEGASRIDAAMSLLEEAKAGSGVVVCSFRTVAAAQLVDRLETNGLPHSTTLSRSIQRAELSLRAPGTGCAHLHPRSVWKTRVGSRSI